MKQTNALARLKTRLGINGPGITIGVIALIFALTGAAFAASGGLSGKQKKEVTAIAKKYAGKPGAQGAPGTPGTAGAPGAKGAAGGAGAAGPAGKSVKVEEVECLGQGGATVEEEGSGLPVEVCNGKEGPPGPEGVCSTSNCVLPPGVVETGTWSFSRSVEKFKTEVGGVEEEVTVGDSQLIVVSLSFPIPLALPLTSAKVHYSTEATFATFCEVGNGSAVEPEPANSKELCVYVDPGEPVLGTTFLAILKATSGLGSEGANKSGALLLFGAPTEDARGDGTFAVKG